MTSTHGIMLPLERLKKSNTAGNLWLYILSLLEKRPLYGWEIPTLIEKEFNFKPGRITPYRVLYRLEAQGFVKSQLEKRRRVYKITQKGQEQIKKAKLFYRWILGKI